MYDHNIENHKHIINCKSPEIYTSIAKIAVQHHIHTHTHKPTLLKPGLTSAGEPVLDVSPFDVTLAGESPRIVGAESIRVTFGGHRGTLVDV